MAGGVKPNQNRRPRRCAKTAAGAFCCLAGERRKPGSPQLPLAALLLELLHVGEDAAGLAQLGGGALLSHGAVLQHHDLVRPGHSAHPVGDHQHRLVLDEPGQGGLDGGLVLYVQAGGGLVQEDDGGVL